MMSLKHPAKTAQAEALGISLSNSGSRQASDESRQKAEMHHSHQSDCGVLTLQQQSGPSSAMLQGCVLRPVSPQRRLDTV